VLQLIVVPPGEYPINRFIQIWNPLIICRITRIRDSMKTQIPAILPSYMELIKYSLIGVERPVEIR
jgi:hypothetical protein